MAPCIFFYGDTEGASPAKGEFWDLYGLWSERREMVMVTGDFNGDGFADLALGNDSYPSDSTNFIREGVVYLFYGTEDGLSFNEPQRVTRFDVQPDIDNALKFSTGFGDHLAVGDFNNDGYSDLAVGSITSGSIRIEETYGNLFLLYGSREGVTGKQSQVWSIDKVPLPEGVTIDNEKRLDYANNFAAGDIDGDGFDDLFVVVGGGFSENYLAQAHLLFGSPSGIHADQLRPWPLQPIANISAFRHIEIDSIMPIIAIHDVNQDGYGDMLFKGNGYPYASESGSQLVHGIFLLPGNSTGSFGEEVHFWAPYGGSNYDFSNMGRAMFAFCDFNGDGNTDVAFGGPVTNVRDGQERENPLYYGPFTGASYTESFSQTFKFEDEFLETPHTVACGDIDGDGDSELFLGRHDIEIAETDWAGVVDIYYGSAQGLPQNYQTRLHQVVDWRVGFGRWRGW